MTTKGGKKRRVGRKEGRMEGRKRDAHRTLYQKLWQRHRGWEGRKEEWKEGREKHSEHSTGRDTRVLHNKAINLVTAWGLCYSMYDPYPLR